MLKTDFYTVRELHAADNHLNCIITFNPEHEIFLGHFPQQPVVPGVCMIQIVKELMQEQTGERLLLQSTGQVKFLQLITPEIEPEIVVEWKKVDNSYMVNTTFKRDRDLFKLGGKFDIVI